MISTKQLSAAIVIGSAVLLASATPALACEKKPVHKPEVHKVVVHKDHQPCPPKTPKSTPTPTPTPTPGKGEVLSTSTTAPAQLQALPATLPDTGAEGGLSALIGIPAMALAGRAYLRSRRTR
jgi:hypothetical protein